MSFIRTQKIKRNDEGKIVSGSASIIKSVYDSSLKYKSRQQVVEKLGKVLWLDENGRKGIFDSPDRGLVEYDSDREKFSDVSLNDERISFHTYVEPSFHVGFGTADLFLSFEKSMGFTALLRKVFSKEADFERVMAHLYHSIMRNGSKEACDDFVGRSVMRYALPEISLPSLSSDTAYFSMMGEPEVKTRYFRHYIEYMKKRYPGFGTSCIVDSVPLPNDIVNNPFRAYSCHGMGAAGDQQRLVLVLDRTVFLPVWFQSIPGNVVDVNTLTQIKTTMKEEFGMDVREYTLDAGYCSKELAADCFPEREGEKTDTEIIVRMPARKGYPYKSLYHKRKSGLDDPGRSFVRNGHTYFGDMELIDLFERKVYAYIYVDHENALTEYNTFISKHKEDFDAMTYGEKCFRRYSGGYFVLLSTMKMSPAELLDRYFLRTGIENFFKTAKDCLDLLPLAKWNSQRIEGKILSDIIASAVYVMIRKEANRCNLSMPRLIGTLESSVCLVDSSDGITVDYPGPKLKEVWSHFGRKQICGTNLSDYFTGLGIKNVQKT